MAHGSDTKSETGIPQWRSDNMLQLVALVGPDLAAELRPADDTEFLNKMGKFAKDIAGMSDDEIRVQWHADDDLLATYRELQAAAGL